MYYQASVLLSLLPLTLAGFNPFDPNAAVNSPSGGTNAQHGTSQPHIMQKPTRRSAPFNPTASSSIGHNGGNMNGPNAPRSVPFNPTAGSSIANNGGNMNGPNAPKKKPILPRSVKRDLEEAYLDLLLAREAKVKDVFADELIARYAYAEADEDDLFAREADDYFDFLDTREAHFNGLLQARYPDISSTTSGRYGGRGPEFSRGPKYFDDLEARDPDISSTTSGRYGGRGPEFSKGPRDLEARNPVVDSTTSGPHGGLGSNSGQIGGPNGGLSGIAGSRYKFNGVVNGPPPGTPKPTIPLTGPNIM